MMKQLFLATILSLSAGANAQENFLLHQKKRAFTKAVSNLIAKYDASQSLTVSRSTMLRRTLKEQVFGGRFVYALRDAIALTPELISSHQCRLIVNPWIWAQSTDEYIRIYDPRAIEDIRGLIAEAIHCE